MAWLDELASVVHHDVHPAIRPAGQGEGGLDGPFAGHVARNSHRALEAVCPCDVLGHGLCAVGVDVGDDDMRALLRQPVRDRAPTSVAAACR